MNVRSTLLALAATLTATVPTGPAAAQAVSIAVPYGDLNLASPAGRAVLDQRVFHAASLICGRYDRRELNMSALSRACRNDAIAGARGQREAALSRGGTDYASLAVSQAAF